MNKKKFLNDFYMAEELEKLKMLAGIEQAEPDQIVDLLDVIEVKMSSYDDEELSLLADILIYVLSKRRGIVAKRAEELLSVIYPHVRQKIVSLLWSDDPFPRNVALKIIVYRRDRDIIESLIKDNDKDIRKFAIDMAFEIGDTEILKKGLDDTDPNVVVSAAEYLSRLGDETVVNMMVKKYREVPPEDIYVLLFFIESFLKIGYSNTVELIKEKFKDVSDPLIKNLYIRACGLSKNETYIKDILDSIKDKDTRSEALESLLIFIREKKLSEDIKQRIKNELAERIRYMSPEEVEKVEKIYKLIES